MIDPRAASKHFDSVTLESVDVHYCAFYTELFVPRFFSLSLVQCWLNFVISLNFVLLLRFSSVIELLMI